VSALVSSPVHVTVFGYGYWGRNVARAMREGGMHVSVYDVDGQAATRAVKAGYGHKPTREIALRESGAVAICTPPNEHAGLVEAALRAGKHVWVEKPVADDPAKSADLIAAAHAAGLALFVDHTFTFAPAVDVLAAELPNFVGTIMSARAHLCVPRAGADVIGDLLPHDASILIRCGLNVRRAMASDWNTSARVDLDLAADGRASIFLSWDSALKERRMTFYGERCTVVYDALDPREPVRVYGGSASDDVAAFSQVAARSPAVASDEPLARAVAAFQAAIEGRAPDNADVALRVERVVWAARRSVRSAGWVEAGA